MGEEYESLSDKYPLTSGKATLRKDPQNYFLYDRQTKKNLIINNDCGEILIRCTGEYTIEDIVNSIRRNRSSPFGNIYTKVQNTLLDLRKDRIISFSNHKDYKPLRIIENDLRFPLDMVFFEVTKECNLKCIHCYADSPNSKKEDVEKSKIFKIIDKLDEAGIMQFIITGGEPFFNKDIFDILGYITAKNMDFGVLTNGTLLDKNKIKRLKELDTKFISVSFDDHRKEVYESIRGKGTYERVINSIEELIKENMPLQINTILFNGLNDKYENLAEFLYFLKEKGVNSKAIVFDEFVPIGSGKDKEFYRFDQDGRADVMKNLKKAFRDVFSKEFIVINDSQSSDLKQDRYCEIGKNAVYINNQGDVSICPLLNDKESIIGNVFKKELQSIVEESEYFNYFGANKFIKDSSCEMCNSLNKCFGGCKAKSKIFSGKFNAIDQWLCEYLKKEENEIKV